MKGAAQDLRGAVGVFVFSLEMLLLLLITDIKTQQRVSQ